MYMYMYNTNMLWFLRLRFVMVGSLAPPGPVTSRKEKANVSYSAWWSRVENSVLTLCS